MPSVQRPQLAAKARLSYVLGVNHCANHVGRLVEIRADSGYRTVEDVDVMFAQIGRVLAKAASAGRVIIVTDWRRCPVMSVEASTRIVPMITRTNPHMERSGAIASRESPIAVLQFMRIIAEAKSPERRLFYETDKLTEWLGEVATPAENARLRAFLNYEEP